MDEGKLVTEKQKGNRQPKTDHLKPWQFKPGQSGNPGGRPKGPSMKTYVKRMLRKMNDEERMEFLKGLDKDVIWKMAEGSPETKSDVTSKGERIMILPPEEIERNKLPSNTEHSSEEQKEI